MFGRSMYVNPPKSVFEDCSGKNTFHMVKVEVYNDVKLCNDIRFEMRTRKSNVPFTPQSGVECKSHDLAFCFRNGISLPNETSYLSVSRNCNPLETLRYVQKVSGVLERDINEDESNNKK